MTPAEVIERATRISAAFLGIADSVGTLAEGKIADMVLLDADPLADVANPRRVHAVTLRGRFFDREALDGILEDVLSAPDLRVNDWPRSGWQPPGGSEPR